MTPHVMGIDLLLLPKDFALAHSELLERTVRPAAKMLSERWIEKFGETQRFRVSVRPVGSDPDVIPEEDAPNFYITDVHPVDDGFVMHTPNLEREVLDAVLKAHQERGNDAG